MLKMGGSLQNLADVMAQKLTTANLIRLKSAFGQAIVDAAVRAYAPASVSVPYFSAAQPSPLRMSHSMFQAKGLLDYLPPTWNMTQEELLIEFLSPANATVESAMTATAVFNYTMLKGSYDLGYYVGGQIVILMDSVDPNINIELGNILGSTVTDIIDTAGTVTAAGYVDWNAFYNGYFDGDFEWYDWIAF